MKTSARPMTEGSIFSHLIRYALPMILGNIMQLTYNAVDSVIIGKCLGEDALAAVSTANPIMTIMVLPHHIHHWMKEIRPRAQATERKYSIGTLDRPRVWMKVFTWPMG